MPTIIFNSHSNNFNEADGPTHCSYASSQSGIGARNRRAASRFFFLGALSFSSFSHLRFLQSLASPSSTAMRIPNRIRKRCREAADALEPAAYRLLKTWSYNLLDVEECGGMFIFAFKTSIRLLCVWFSDWSGQDRNLRKRLSLLRKPLLPSQTLFLHLTKSNLKSLELNPGRRLWSPSSWASSEAPVGSSAASPTATSSPTSPTPKNFLAQTRRPSTTSTSTPSSLPPTLRRRIGQFASDRTAKSAGRSTKSLGHLHQQSAIGFTT